MKSWGAIDKKPSAYTPGENTDIRYDLHNMSDAQYMHLENTLDLTGRSQSGQM